MSKRLPHLSGAVLSRAARSFAAQPSAIRPSAIRPWIIRPWAMAALLGVLSLAGCGPDRSEFAPPCPTPVFEQTLGDVSRYRPGSDGRDLTDLVVQGRLVSVSGQCKLTSRKGDSLLVAVRLGMQVTRGPALQGNAVDLPVFVAVTDGDTILDKKDYVVHAEFPSNVQMVALAGAPIDMTLPITATKSGAAYQIRIGFQLTPDELEANRRRLAH
ncbi:MAG: hypothetical protein P4L71_18450 [Acetobacteraceae bacterium]|nr:hypothetical protein [Acetobacteraceae bacterium]